MNKKGKNNKYTYEYIKSYIENMGYELLSQEYINVKNKLLIKCDKGHEFEMSFDSILNKGCRCPECKGERISKSKRFDYKYVKEYIESYGYKLVSKEYKNSKTKLNLICDKDHKIQMTFGDFKRGDRCSKCYKERRGKSRRFDYNYVKDYIESFGYKLLSKEYINKRKKLLIKCNNGHIFEMCFETFKNGKCRCPQCRPRNKYKYEDIKKNMEKEKYILLTPKEEYKNVGQKLDIICSNNHHYKITYAHWLEGKRCAICNFSKGEKIINNFLIKNNINFEFQKQYDELLGLGGKNLSYDFYLPDYNLLIEFQGKQHEEFSVGFHSSKRDFERQLEHDRRKFNYAVNNNIDILYLYSWQIDEIEEILKYELQL